MLESLVDPTSWLRGEWRRRRKEPSLNEDPAAAGNRANRDTSKHGIRALSLRGAWRLAGVLYLAGALFGLPAHLLLTDSPPIWVYGLNLLAASLGVACLTMPWSRLDERWLAVLPVISVGLIAVAVAFSDFIFTFFYFFVALFVGLVFPQLRQMWPFLVLMVAALFVPFLHTDESLRQTLLWALVIGPAVVLTSVVVGYLTAGLEESRAAYRQMSAEDGLTGVGNYRALIERLRHETARHQRRQREFTLLTLDLNRFKALNETRGHLLGDFVLAIVGAMIDLNVRIEDTVFRQGGDEFSVLAPETGRHEAELLARRIERGISRIRSGEFRMSVAVGGAIFPHDGTEPAELMESADASLRARKRELAAQQAGSAL